MNYFYFFKVTLSYFDDERKTFFITPDQSETDEQGVPFSENDLQDTAEFKEFVKTTKADIIDVDYTEFAVEYDPKKSDILHKPVTDESFTELEKSGLPKIIDENQIILVLKTKKRYKSGSRLPILWGVWIATVIVFALVAVAFKDYIKRNFENGTSDISVVSEGSEEMSESESGVESISDEQSAAESIPNTAESSTSLTTTSATALEPSESVSSDASSVTTSQSIPAESSEETHEAVTVSSDVSD